MDLLSDDDSGTDVPSVPSAEAAASKATKRKRQDEKSIATSSKKRTAKQEQARKNVLEGARKDAKKEFEAKRDAFLSTLPDLLKRMFGQMGFVKYQKEFLPVLILSPYNVPPSQTRDNWLTGYENVRCIGLNDAATLPTILQYLLILTWNALSLWVTCKHEQCRKRGSPEEMTYVLSGPRVGRCW
jgi:hypothetical protein